MLNYLQFQDLIQHMPSFCENFHMTLSIFENIFSLLEDELKPKVQTRPYDFISEKEKFAAVLEYTKLF